MIINRVVAVTHVPSFQHWKIQPQSLCLCLTFYLCLYLYFSSWAVDVAHVTESPALANTESGRSFCVFVCICGFLFLATWTVDVAHVSGFQRWQGYTTCGSEKAPQVVRA